MSQVGAACRLVALRAISQLQDRCAEHHSSQRRAVAGSENSSWQMEHCQVDMHQPQRHYATAPRPLADLIRQMYTTTPLASTSVP